MRISEYCPPSFVCTPCKVTCASVITALASAALIMLGMNMLQSSENRRFDWGVALVFLGAAGIAVSGVAILFVRVKVLPLQPHAGAAAKISPDIMIDIENFPLKTEAPVI